MGNLKVKKWGIMLLLAVSLFGISSCSEDLAEVSETIYVQRDKVKMPVYMRGNVASKVIILVVHGGPGGSGYEYRSGKYAETLESKYGMAYWDQRGQGMAQGKFGDNDLTVDIMVDDLRAVVLALKEKYGDETGIFLFGHSWGGTLGTAFMVKDDYQKHVKGWIESNGAHDIPKLNKDAIIMFRQVAQQQIDAGNSVSQWTDILSWANGVDTSNISTDQGGEINSKGFEAEDFLANDGVLSKGDDGSMNIFSSPINMLTSLISGNSTSNKLHDEVENTALTDQLHKITTPTLLLWGQYDFVVPPALGQDAKDKIQASDVSLVLFTKSGHSPMNNEPDLYTDEIIKFIERNK